jgi:hypothetical protein
VTMCWKTWQTDSDWPTRCSSSPLKHKGHVINWYTYIVCVFMQAYACACVRAFVRARADALVCAILQLIVITFMKLLLTISSVNVSTVFHQHIYGSPYHWHLMKYVINVSVNKINNALTKVVTHYYGIVYIPDHCWLYMAWSRMHSPSAQDFNVGTMKLQCCWYAWQEVGVKWRVVWLYIHTCVHAFVWLYS